MDVKALAAEHGFAACFVFTTEEFVHYERRLQDGALHYSGTALITDISKKTPWANAILALIYPYRPYSEGIAVSRYYPAGDAAYHASIKLMDVLHANDIQTERVLVPVRELLTRNCIGMSLKSGLTFLPGFGTRFSFQALVVSLPEPDYTPKQKVLDSRCNDCQACERICPSQAISKDGYDFKTCARAYMGGDVMEPWVMDAMTCILGCELCQKVCPYNFGIEPITDLPDAFRLEELLLGNVKPVLEIVGKNLNKKGRIIQHACIVAAKQGRSDLIPFVEPWLVDEREAVRVAAAYALKKLRA